MAGFVPVIPPGFIIIGPIQGQPPFQQGAPPPAPVHQIQGPGIPLLPRPTIQILPTAPIRFEATPVRIQAPQQVPRIVGVRQQQPKNGKIFPVPRKSGHLLQTEAPNVTIPRLPQTQSNQIRAQAPNVVGKFPGIPALPQSSPIIRAEQPVVDTPPTPLPSLASSPNKCVFCCSPEDNVTELPGGQKRQNDDPRLFHFLCDHLTLAPQLLTYQTPKDLPMCLDCTKLYVQLHDLYNLVENIKMQMGELTTRFQTKVMTSAPSPESTEYGGEAGRLCQLLRAEIVRQAKNSGWGQADHNYSCNTTPLNKGLLALATKRGGRSIDPGTSDRSNQQVTGLPAPTKTVPVPIKTVPVPQIITIDSPPPVLMKCTASSRRKTMHRERTFVGEEEEVPNVDSDYGDFPMEEVEIFQQEVITVVTLPSNELVSDQPEVLSDPLDDCDVDSLFVDITVEEYLHRIRGDDNTKNSQFECWFDKGAKLKPEEDFRLPLAWKCSECAAAYRSKITLYDHLKREHKGLDGQYSCFVPNCERKFSVPFLRWHHAGEVHLRKLPFFCGKDGVKFGEERRFNKHKAVHEDKDPYTCRFCSMYSPKVNPVRKHELAVHSDEFVHVCTICQAKFYKESFLLSHLTTHAPHGPYICLLCQGVCKYKEDLDNHHFRCHFLERRRGAAANHATEVLKQIPCKICGKVFESEASFRRHQYCQDARELLKPAAACEKCPGMKFRNTIHLVNHILRLHEQEVNKTFTCGKCSKGFVTNYMYTRHLKFHKVENAKPLSCGVCERRFSTAQKDKFDHHVKTQHTRLIPQKTARIPRVPCQFCSHLVGGSGYLRKHQLIIHNDKFIYECHMCDVKYPVQAFLEAHLATHSTNEPYVCTICKVEFVTQQQLKGHVQKHTGEVTRMLLCDKCDKTFPHKESLLRHLATEHGGEKPYICTVCGKQFAVRSGLSVHVRSRHMPQVENPPRFPCKRCSKTFVNEFVLEKHVRQVHEKRFWCSCEICGKVLTTRFSLSYHLRDMHNETMSKDYRPHYITPRERFKSKLLSCYFCDMKTRNRATLNMHMSSHTLEEPYICNVPDCKDSFRFSQQLRAHAYSHRIENEINEKVETADALGSMPSTKTEPMDTDTQPDEDFVNSTSMDCEEHFLDVEYNVVKEDVEDTEVYSPDPDPKILKDEHFQEFIAE